MTRARAGARVTDETLETIEFRVIGERRDDPGHLLLIGPAGEWYDYALEDGTITRIDPTDAWAVDRPEIAPASPSTDQTLITA
jgi:hypothetical protein